MSPGRNGWVHRKVRPTPLLDSDQGCVQSWGWSLIIFGMFHPHHRGTHQDRAR